VLHSNLSWETPDGPLRRRMIEDMTVRNLSPATQRSYVHAVRIMSANQAVFLIATMARVLGVSEAGYHAWRHRPLSSHELPDAAWGVARSRQLSGQGKKVADGDDPGPFVEPERQQVALAARYEVVGRAGLRRGQQVVVMGIGQTATAGGLVTRGRPSAGR
jgi:hypothetical protein